VTIALGIALFVVLLGTIAYFVGSAVKIPVGIPIFVAAAGINPRYAKTIHNYVLSATVWLLIGSAAGLLNAFRFIYPDHLAAWSWASMGRVRPSHTAMVLFGWASLALMGIGNYVVPRSSKTDLWSIGLARAALWLWNLGLAAGVVALLLGMSNGSQEYRELPMWSAAFLAVGAALTAVNLYKTIRNRRVNQIYISNWFFLGACLLILVVVGIAYIPGLRRGIGQTVVQGWFMHNVVGMWFTPLAVGATYYALPKLLNKPIYSYALGVLGFWTHLVFYTLIGTHHYIFGPLPQWLQTTSIIFSTAMMVPVWASTGNFLLTMKGERQPIRISYSLPFLLVGAFAYGLASVQGTFQAFRGTHELLHFTDYTVGHSHLAMVGFVSFLAWGAIYGLLPRVTGREPNVEMVGVHFWLSVVGTTMMVLALSIGGEAQGRGWLAGLPFLDTVRDHGSTWVLRFVGGSFMALGHIVFAINVWTMRPGAFVQAMPPPEEAKS
jgi:cytochrome c oxidase cbb3-type subunit I